MADFVRDQASTGRRDLGTISRAGGRFIDVEAGFGYVKLGPPVDASPAQVVAVTWADQSIEIPANSDRHIVVDQAGVVSLSASHPDIEHFLVLGACAADASSIVWLSQFTVDIINPIADLDNWIRDVVGPLVSSGLVVQPNASPLKLDVSAGEFYINKDNKSTAGGAAVTFSLWYRDPLSPLGWTVVPGQDSIDPNNYDDGSGTLAALAPGQWKKDLVLASPLDETTTEYHVIYGQEVFADQTSAEVGNIPATLAVLLRHTVRLAGLVVTQGAAAIATVVDIRPRLGQYAPPSTSVTSHGDLTDLLSDDHTQYQLRTEKGAANGYASLGAGGLVPTTQLPAATEAAQGAAEIATQAETDTGTDDIRIVTSLKLRTNITSTVRPATRTDNFGVHSFGPFRDYTGAQGSPQGANEIQYMRVWLRAGVTIASMRTFIAGGADGVRQIQAAIYDQVSPTSDTQGPNNRVATTAADTPPNLFTGIRDVALSAPYAVTTTGWYHLALQVSSAAMSFLLSDTHRAGTIPRREETTGGFALPATAGATTQPQSAALYCAAVE